MTFKEAMNYKLSYDKTKINDVLESKEFEVDSGEAKVYGFLTLILFFLGAITNIIGWGFALYMASSPLNLPFFALFILIPVLAFCVNWLVGRAIGIVNKWVTSYWTIKRLCYLLALHTVIVIIANCGIHYYLN